MAKIKHLVNAIKTSNIAYTKKLIQQYDKQHLGTRIEWGQTALHVAAVYGNREICKVLIPEMCQKSIDTTDFNGYTALHCASLKGMLDVCELLVPRMSPDAINACDRNYNQTALHYAAFGGHREICRLLISNMSSDAINTVTTGPFGLFSSGKTALYWAAWNDLTDVCDLLVSKMSHQAVNDTLDACVTKGLNTLSTIIKTSQAKLEPDSYIIGLMEDINIDSDPLTAKITPHMLGDIKSDADLHD